MKIQEDAITWVYGMEDLSANEKFLLITLCFFSDSAFVCYLSSSGLAFKTGLSVQTIYTMTAKLEDIGLIHRMKLRTGNLYKVKCPNGITGIGN